MSRARKRLREILSGPDCTAAAPIFDPLSARIAEMVGWELCKLSGSVGKAANLAVPDGVPIANMSDLVDICRRINRVAEVILIVDADEGGGGVMNVWRTVRELEAAGVAAIELEDNLVPERFGDDRARHSLLISKAEQVGKLKAAVAARQDPSTVIVARTSALSELPLPEALDRIADYSRTGAEAIMLPDMPPRGRADIEALHHVTDLPLCVLGLPLEDLQDQQFLADNNVRIRFLGQPVYGMAVKAIHDCLMYLKDGGNPRDMQDRVASSQLLRAVDRTPELMHWESTFAKPLDL